MPPKRVPFKVYNSSRYFERILLLLPKRLVNFIGPALARARAILRPPKCEVSLREFAEGNAAAAKGAGRILLVLNHAIRERHLFESICAQILELAPGTVVSILDYRDPMFVKKAIE